MIDLKEDEVLVTFTIGHNSVVMPASLRTIKHLTQAIPVESRYHGEQYRLFLIDNKVTVEVAKEVPTKTYSEFLYTSVPSKEELEDTSPGKL